MTDPYSHLLDGKLLFEGPVNAHDVLVTPLNWQGTPGKVVAEADIQPVANPGSSWAPALILYWDTAKFVSIGISGNAKFNLNPGGYTGSAPIGSTYRVRIVWENGTVQLWGGVKGTVLTLQRTAPAPASGPPPYLIVGKGFGSTTVYTKPFLANDYTDVGARGTVYMDNIAVYADDVLKLEEAFENGVDFNRWQVLMSPSVEPRPPVDLKDLYPNWVAPAERGSVSPPKVLYKEADWNAYYNKVQSSAEFRTFSEQKINALKNEVSLVMSYNEAQIDNMIPATTPNADLFTPCPNDPTRGFPHGDWKWSPNEPDIMYCGNVAFPNDQYPEEGVMIANWGGVEQRITYYNRMSYDFSGFKLSPSFTSYIRAKKVVYMSNTVSKISILYKLTGDPAYAQQGKKILMRFAEVYPHWLLHSGYGEYADMDPKTAAFSIKTLPRPELTAPPNVANHVLHTGYWMAGRGDANGMEGSFILPLVNAYDLLNSARVDEQALLSDNDRLVIERDLLLESAALFLADTSINNKSISNRTAAAAIGLAVSEPKLVRFGLQGFNQLMSEWYKADGSPTESAAYGLQVLEYLWRLGEILEGYSDPPGYTPPAGEQRTDGFTVYNRSDYRMVYKTLGEALLPSMKYPAIGDSYTTSTLAGYSLGIGAKRTGLPILSSLLRYGGFNLYGVESLLYRPENLEQAEPLRLPDVVFPEWKLAYMRGGLTNMDSAAILNASDWGTHRHLDSLDLSYWANGGESLSDFGYLWDNPQKYMTARSAAHNLVVVNKKDQKDTGRGGSIDFYEAPGPVHATEASSHAYSEADVYARTLLQMQKTDRKPEYLVDFFRVRGGNSHDYMLHAAATDLTTNQIQLTPGGGSSVSAYGMKNVRTTETNHVWTAGWKNAGGAGWTQSWQVPLSVTESVYIGSGWGQRGKDDAGAELPYLVRHRDNSPGGSTFASVFESYTGTAGVQEVVPLTVANSVYAPDVLAPVGLWISGNGWHDYVFSSQGNMNTPQSFIGGSDGVSTTFSGRLGVLSYANGNGQDGLQYAFLAGEGRIEQDGEGIMIEEGQQKEGSIAQRLQDGFAAAGIVADADKWIGSHVLVKKGTDWTAYPVLDVRVEQGNTRFITYTANEGFPFAGGDAWKLVPYAAAKRMPSGEWTITSSAGRAELTYPLQTAASVAGQQRQGWYTSDATVTLQVYGNPNNVSSTVYSLNGGASWTGYTVPIVLRDSGVHVLQYRSTDLAGNVEPVQAVTVKIDRLPPVTLPQVNGTAGEGGWYTSASLVTMSTYDVHSGVDSTEYALTVTASTYGQQGHGFVPYTGPIALDEGKYRLQFRSTDAAGNVETAQTADVFIDRTAPAVTLFMNGTPVVSGMSVEDNQSILLTLQANDGMSGVAQWTVLVDGAAYTEGTAIRWTGQPGDHILKVTVRDQAGNRSEASYTVHVTTSPASVLSLIAGYVQSGELQYSLEVKLTNSMRQAEHHWSSGRKNEALHFLDKFLQDVNEQQSGISAAARLALQADALALQQLWSASN